MDILSKEERSRNMAAIKSSNTKPEILLRKWLFARGYRFRVNVNHIPGHPDIYLRKYNTAVFVHGCFWHRHVGCKYSYNPKSRFEFWERKFKNNINRDSAVQQALFESSIKCIIIWECTIKTMKKDIEYRNTVMQKIENYIQENVDGSDKNRLKFEI